MINNIQLPDLDDGHGSYLKGNKLTILERTSKVDFYPDVAKNAVVFSNKKISAIATCEKFRYKIAPLIFADGSAEVDINTIEIDAGLSFSTTVLPSGHVVPYVTGADVYTHINRFDIVVKLQGNYITEIGEIAQIFFQGTIADLLEKEIINALNVTVPGAFNKAIAFSNGYFPMPVFKNWVVDWQTPEAATVTDTYIGIGVKGLYFDSSIGEEEPAVAIPDMPYHNTSHTEQFQTYVSSYDIDGFFNSLLEVTQIKGWLNASLTGLDTSMVNKLLVGISGYYGPD